MLHSRIIRNEHAFLLEVNGRQMPMYGYMSYQPSKADYAAFRQAGVHLFFTGVYAGDRGINPQSGLRPFRPGFWKGYGEYDFSAVDEDFRTVLNGATKGEDYLIPRLMLEPPSWWEADNPTELCRDAQGCPVHQSYHSKKWRLDTHRVMRDFQRWLDASGWADYVPGWHIACGSTEEWLRPQFYPGQLTDYSPLARRAFMDWAKDKYHSRAAINAAWHTSFARLEDIDLPSPALRMYGLHGALRDPDLERYTTDYYRFMNESHSQALIDLCAMAKEVTGQKQVIGAFFGYTSCDGESGHHAAGMVFDSEHVDFLASPLTYTDNRAQGVDWAFPGAVESAALHGKPWFVEADVRTCLSRPISQCMPFSDPPVNRAYDGPVWLGPEDVAGSLGQMVKAFSRALTHNTAIWWFDMFGGWYRHDAFMAFHRQAARLYRHHALSGGSENAAPVAVFVSDLTYDELTPGRAAAHMGYDLLRYLGWMGTPYQLYMMDDFAAVDPQKYRLAIFPCVSHWSEDQLAALDAWKQGSRTLAFLGPVDVSPASGVQAEFGDQTEPLPAEIGHCECPVTVRQMRLVPQTGDVVLSRASDGGATEILRRSPTHNIYVTTAFNLTDEQARQLVLASGGQVYAINGDVAYASRHYLAIHARQDGVRRLCAPDKVYFQDVFTGDVLSGNETFVDISMNKGETRLFRLTPITAEEQKRFSLTDALSPRKKRR